MSRAITGGFILIIHAAQRTSVYTDQYGKVLRVIGEDGSISDLSRYTYAMDGNDLILTFADSGRIH